LRKSISEPALLADNLEQHVAAQACFESEYIRLTYSAAHLILL
jgi:hypothetical protein